MILEHLLLSVIAPAILLGLVVLLLRRNLHRISKLREKKGLTQAQLAANSNLTIRKMQRIECGEGRITYLDMAAIAEQLQVSLHQLLKGIA